MNTETFISKVNEGIGTRQCWLFCGSNNKGIPTLFQQTWSTETYAPRISYTIFKGNLDKNCPIYNTCGNSLCVNPDHLVMASFVQNKPKQRIVRQPLPYTLKDLMKLKFEGKSYTQISKQYNTTAEIIWYALN